MSDRRLSWDEALQYWNACMADQEAESGRVERRFAMKERKIR